MDKKNYHQIYFHFIYHKLFYFFSIVNIIFLLVFNLRKRTYTGNGTVPVSPTHVPLWSHTGVGGITNEQMDMT